MPLNSVNFYSQGQISAPQTRLLMPLNCQQLPSTSTNSQNILPATFGGVLIPTNATALQATISQNVSPVYYINNSKWIYYYIYWYKLCFFVL